ncbi:MAG: hypothetical protein FJ116_02430 [Deltaproteobacteria bacterium]|nr:hypothetical protein [Deltaproteobacteria bacterium]
MKFLFFLVALSLLLCWQKIGFGYPAYIGTGYSSCLTCHFNPMGNGPINTYGRAVQATEMSGNLFGQKLEQLAEGSGFLFGIGSLPEWLQLQGSYRGLYVGRSLQATPSTRYLVMQAEGSIAMTFGKKFRASASVGYVPLPPSLSESQAKQLGNTISREHYIGFLPEKGVGIYVGLMDTAFGLRVPDHNAFIRSVQLLNINDQTHGILFHRDWAKGEFAIHGFMGKLFQESNARQKGGSIFSEFEVLENFRAGASLLYTFSDFRKRQMFAGHGRLQMGKGSSLLAEIGIFNQELSSFDMSSKTQNTGIFSFLQSRHLFVKGFYGLMTFENYIETFSQGGSRVYRAGPSLEYLPFPKIEIRVDFLGTQVMGLTSITPSSYTAQVQSHVWL